MICKSQQTAAQQLQATTSTTGSSSSSSSPISICSIIVDDNNLRLRLNNHRLVVVGLSVVDNHGVVDIGSVVSVVHLYSIILLYGIVDIFLNLTNITICLCIPASDSVISTATIREEVFFRCSDGSIGARCRFDSGVRNILIGSLRFGRRSGSISSMGCSL